MTAHHAVGIPTINVGSGNLVQTIHSILQQTVPTDSIIVSVPPGTPHELEWVPRPARSLVHFVSADATGTASQRNAILREVGDSIDLLHLIDDDIVLAPNYFFVIEQLMGARHLIGATGDLLFTSGPSQDLPRWQSVARRMALAGYGTGQVTRSGINCPPLRDLDDVSDVSWLPGGLMSLDARRLGSRRFCEDLERGPTKGYAMAEDVHFSLNLLSGGALAKVWTAKAQHIGNEAWKPQSKEFWEMKVWSRMLLARDFPERISPTAVRYSVLCEILSRIVGPSDQTRRAAIAGLWRGLYRSSVDRDEYLGLP